MLADSIGLALLVVLETLTPAERLAFVLHDLFAVPYEEIAPIVGRSTVATRQLASRARRRVQDTDRSQATDPGQQREIVTAFLAASREGDFSALVSLLDPDVVIRADLAAVAMGATDEVRGADAVATTFAGRAKGARAVLVDGVAGAVWSQGGAPRIAFEFTIGGGRIVAVEMVADPEVLGQLDVSPLAG